MKNNKMNVSKIILTICLSFFFSFHILADVGETIYEDSTTTVEVVDSFGVTGKCGMCKRAIEKAALGVAGVTKAFWDVDKQQLTINIDEANFAKEENRLDTIKNAVATAGYDTDTIKASDEAYEGLPGCCHYKRDAK